MAEIFGVVASAVGVVGVAAQCADGIRKLREFQKDVKGAPEELGYIADELDLLTISVESIERQIRNASHTATGIEPTGALILCQRCITSTAAIVHDLNEKIAKKETRGSLKAAWNKKVLEGYMTRIERAKSSLTIACNTYDRELSQRGFAMVHENFDRVQSTLVTFQVPIMITHTDPTLSLSGQQENRMYTPGKILSDEDEEQAIQPKRRQRKRRSETFATVSCTAIKKRPAVKVARIHLRLPSWILTRSIVLDIHRTAQSWNINLQPRRLVPFGSDFFMACFNGNLVDARKLLEEGKASVYDVDEYGDTALHKLGFGVRHGLADNEEDWSQLLDLLVDSGADLNASDNIGRLPLSDFLRIPDLHSSHQPEIRSLPKALYRLTADMEEDAFIDQLGIIMAFRRNINLELLRTCREHFRLDLTSCISGFCAVLDDVHTLHAGVLDIWIGNDNWERVWSGCPDWMYHKLIEKMSYSFGDSVRDNDRTEMERWRSIFRHAITHCTTNQTARKFPTHIFWESFTRGNRWHMINASSDAPRRLEEALTTCMEEMVACGIDLEAIGKTEPGLQATDALDKEQDYWFYIPEDKHPSVYVRIIAVRFGPQPSDCQVWLSDPLVDAVTELFGEFWEMVDHPEWQIPGAWTPEETPVDDCPKHHLEVEFEHQATSKEIRRYLWSIRILADEVSQMCGEFWAMVYEWEERNSGTSMNGDLEDSRSKPRPRYLDRAERCVAQTRKWVEEQQASRHKHFKDGDFWIQRNYTQEELDREFWRSVFAKK